MLSCLLGGHSAIPHGDTQPNILQQLSIILAVSYRRRLAWGDIPPIKQYTGRGRLVDPLRHNLQHPRQRLAHGVYTCEPGWQALGVMAVAGGESEKWYLRQTGTTSHCPLE